MALIMERYNEGLGLEAIQALKVLRASPDDPHAWDACWEKLAQCPNPRHAKWLLEFMQQGLVPPSYIETRISHYADCGDWYTETQAIYGALAGPVVYERKIPPQLSSPVVVLSFGDDRPRFVYTDSTSWCQDLLAVCTPGEAARLLPYFCAVHRPRLRVCRGFATGIRKYDALLALGTMMTDSACSVQDFRAAVWAKVLAGAIAIDDRDVLSGQSLAAQTAHSALPWLGPRRAVLSLCGADPQQFLRAETVSFPAFAWALLAGLDPSKPLRYYMGPPPREWDEAQCWPAVSTHWQLRDARVAWAMVK
jgi:hypothetical protein